MIQIAGGRHFLVAQHPAVPHGDMMLSGCFGLLDGFAYRVPEASHAAAGGAAPRDD